MGFLDKIRQLVQDGSARTHEGFARFRHGAFAEATMAACALISAADGHISDDERRRTVAFIETSDTLKAFDISILSAKYDEYCTTLTRDFDVGKLNLMHVISTVKQPEEARAVVQLAVIIGHADGTFDDAEQRVVREIIYILKLSPSEFDLPISLMRGANLSLSQIAPGLGAVRIGLGWDPRVADGQEIDLDGSAFLLNDQGKTRRETDFVFYNNANSADGSVMHTGDSRTGQQSGDDETVDINLHDVPTDVQRIAFGVTIHQADIRQQNFGQVRNAYIRVIDRNSQAELVRFDLSHDASTETAMVFGELYRHGTEWKFKAIGQGYAGGLAALAGNFGIQAG